MQASRAWFFFPLVASLVACSDDELFPCGFESGTFSESATRTFEVAQGHEFGQAIAIGGQAGSTVYTVVSGELPPGIEISGGSFAGTATTIGNYTFTLRGDSSDNSCASTTRSLTVKVVEAKCESVDACYAAPVSYATCSRSADCPAPEFGGRGYCVATSGGRGVCVDDGTKVGCGAGTQEYTYKSMEGRSFTTCAPEGTYTCKAGFCK
jgi:hypothetical protein